MPLPNPVVNPVSVIQLAFDTALHVHVRPAVTVTLPVVAAADTEPLAGEMPGAHGELNEKPFEAELALLPPGPSAVTRAS